MYDEIKRYVAENFTCNPETGLIFRKTGSHVRAAGSPIGHRMVTGYMAVALSPLGKKVYSHHIVWFLCNGEWPPETGKEIDHVDRDRGNNRLSNLRLTSHSVNMCNTAAKNWRRYRASKPRYAGQVCVGQEHRMKAGFDTPEAASEWAHETRREMLSKLPGEILGA